jgi:hypothetical protein
MGILILGGTFALGLFGGLFVTSFDLNQCYNEVINSVAQHAESDLKSGAPDAAARFAAYKQSLPLHGYETSCRELRAAASKQP